MYMCVCLNHGHLLQRPLRLIPAHGLEGLPGLRAAAQGSHIPYLNVTAISCWELDQQPPPESRANLPGVSQTYTSTNPTNRPWLSGNSVRESQAWL